MINLKSIQTEIDASFLYALLSEHEEDENVAKVFVQMSAIELSHAEAFAHSHGLPLDQLPGPSWRAKTLARIGKILGYDYVLGGRWCSVAGTNPDGTLGCSVWDDSSLAVGV